MRSLRYAEADIEFLATVGQKSLAPQPFDHLFAGFRKVANLVHYCVHFRPQVAS
jgi:hypothetical protein